jgi:hypothetical protein
MFWSVRNSKAVKFRSNKGWSWVMLLVMLLTACGEPTATPTLSSASNPATSTPAPTSIPTTPTPPPLATAPGVIVTTSSAISVTTQPSSTTSAPSPTVSGFKPGTFQRVFIIVLENANYDQSMAQTYLSELSHKGAALNNFHAETHPSYPNYLALVAGNTFGIDSDGQTDLDKTNLSDLMETAKISWKVYAEQLPTQPCSKVIQSGTYVRKHEPFISFLNVQKDPNRCAKIVNSNQLAKDIAAGQLSQYNLYIPDLNNDGHDTGVGYASKWLQGFLTPLMAEPKFAEGTLVVVTFDEALDSSPDNQIYTVLLGNMVKAGSSSVTPYTHYSLLRTIEDNFGLGNLGREDAKAKSITDIWRDK